MRQLLLWDAITSLLPGWRDADADVDSARAGARDNRSTRTISDGSAQPRPPASSGVRSDVADAPAALVTERTGTSSTSVDVVSTASPAPDSVVEFVRHPRAKRYLIRVRLDGSVRVTIPRRGSRREAEAFYQQQRGWVTEHQQRVANARAAVPDDLSPSEQRMLRARAKRELPPRLLELAQTAGVTVRRVSVRSQRHRWGSCSASGLICLNWRLVTMPDWVRDYVLVHELMHLKRMDHSPAFWAHVASMYPNYKAARRWLRRHALAPHSVEAHRDMASGADDPDDWTAPTSC